MMKCHDNDDEMDMIDDDGCMTVIGVESGGEEKEKKEKEEVEVSQEKQDSIKFIKIATFWTVTLDK